MEVHLERLGSENWEECAKLSVAKEQRDFVDTNLYAVAEAGIEDLEPFAVYTGEDMVGMAVLDWSPPDGSVDAVVLHHFMIDHRHQRRGFGRAALLAAAGLARKHGVRRVLLSYWPGNPAAGLYESVGFRHTGENWSIIGVEDSPSEPVMQLEL